jgi:large subunit ribosomal protein L5
MAQKSDNKKSDSKSSDKAKGAQAQAAAKAAKAKRAAAASAEPPPQYKREQPPRLKRLYQDEVKKKLLEEFGYKNVMQVPTLQKITLNMGLGRAVSNPKLLESGLEEMRVIAGQAPVVCLAKRDIATFKLRKQHKIGVMVTLRGERMWEFLDRLISVALPRVRDFRGVSSKAFDGRGNYNLGVREQIIFPEVDYDAIDSVKGLNVTMVTTAETDAEGRALLRHLGMPFRQSGAAQGAQA